MVLIDSGPSHIFTSLGLGEKHQKQTQGCCRDVEVHLQEYRFKEMFLLFELGRSGFNLGCNMGSSIGKVKVQR